MKVLKLIKNIMFKERKNQVVVVSATRFPDIDVSKSPYSYEYYKEQMEERGKTPLTWEQFHSRIPRN